LNIPAKAHFSRGKSMQVTVETTRGLERRVKVQVPEDRIQGEVSKRLTSIAQSARLPGFRPGKAPMKVIAQRYGKQVREEVVGEIVQSSFQDAIVQERLRPAGNPTIDPLEWESGSGVAYTAVFDVYPEVSLPPVESLKISRPVAEIGDADLERMLERLRTQRRGWVGVERAATRGDRVVMDFEGTCEGEARDDLKAEGFAVELAVLGPAFPFRLRGRCAGRKTGDFRHQGTYGRRAGVARARRFLRRELRRQGRRNRAAEKRGPGKYAARAR
jgi:trigger factor